MLERLKWMNPAQIRFLIAGGWNTLFGYLCGVSLYYLLIGHISVFAIGAIANVIAISMSFLIYKLYVFRSLGNWLQEYLRSYVVYGAGALLSIALFWFTIDRLGITVWLAQAITLAVVALLSYIGNARFTFRNRQ